MQYECRQIMTRPDFMDGEYFVPGSPLSATLA